MKVLLVTSHHRLVNSRWMPLGPCYIGALLKKNGHSVRIFDRLVEHHRAHGNADSVQNRMKSIILQFMPDIIGLSTTSRSIYDTVNCIAFIRDFYDGLIVAGGYHATAMPTESFNKIRGLDAIIVGEGEYPLLHLLDYERRSVSGILWKDDDPGKPIVPYRVSNLDSLPFPDMDLLDTDYYRQADTATIRGFNLRYVSLLTSRGCLNKCYFCSESLTFGSGVRYNSPEYVIENIAWVLNKYDINGIYFHDNDFLSAPDRVVEICRHIVNRGYHKRVEWCIQARSDNINKQVLKELKRAGCVKIEIGIESLVQQHLNDIGKRVKSSDQVYALHLCRKHGIRAHGYLMHGYNHETIDSLEEEFRRIKRLPLDSITWSVMKASPGTKFYLDYGNKYFENNEWSEAAIETYYTKKTFSSLSEDEKEKWMKRYFIPFAKRKARYSLLRNNGFMFFMQRIIKKISKSFSTKCKPQRPDNPIQK